MVLGEHFFSDYDDDEYFYSPYRARGYYPRQSALEARRRAELERQYRLQKQHDEVEELRRKQKTMRWPRQRQQEEEEYRQIQNAVMRRRQVAAEAEAEERLRRRRQRQHQWQEDDQQEAESSSDEETSNPIYRVVRGVDGRLYRVQVGYTGKKHEKPTRTSPPVQNKEKAAPSGRTMSRKSSKASRPQRNKKLVRRPTEETSRDDNLEATTLEEPETSSPRSRKLFRKQPSRSSNKGKKRVTIIVEDASDSEYEADELNSPWHNRLPSPGQWMEPVEGYDMSDAHCYN